MPLEYRLLSWANQNLAHDNQSEFTFAEQTVSKIYIEATKSGLFYET